MKPVVVSATVPVAVEEVFDFLDVMSNHEAFTDHFLREWNCTGPGRGVGAKATVNAVAAGRTDTVDIEVIAAAPPTLIVERNTRAGAGSIARGSYTLEALSSGLTHVTFEYAWERAPLSERLTAPLVRGMLRRANQRAMQRLTDRLVARRPRAAT